MVLFRHARPLADAYYSLRVRAGLSAKTVDAVERALASTLFGVFGSSNDALVAMGCIIADGGCHCRSVTLRYIRVGRGAVWARK
ncbi:hypothetical protein [Xanthomonas prunicola]|uniref:hypothetical protein n=1 Tax=Xanthomonas prunicola TaxID=2053930 RepID=UPI001FAFEA63|nr:hypothetical protein [Xanthomonas prunicola]